MKDYVFWMPAASWRMTPEACVSCSRECFLKACKLKMSRGRDTWAVIHPLWFTICIPLKKKSHTVKFCSRKRRIFISWKRKKPITIYQPEEKLQAKIALLLKNHHKPSFIIIHFCHKKQLQNCTSSFLQSICIYKMSFHIFTYIYDCYSRTWGHMSLRRGSCSPLMSGYVAWYHSMLQ